MLEIVRTWLLTGAITPPAKGDETYIGFPAIGEGAGQFIARRLQEEGLGVVFYMGEFCRLKEKYDG